MNFVHPRRVDGVEDFSVGPRRGIDRAPISLLKAAAFRFRLADVYFCTPWCRKFYLGARAAGSAQVADAGAEGSLDCPGDLKDARPKISSGSSWLPGGTRRNGLNGEVWRENKIQPGR